MDAAPALDTQPLETLHAWLGEALAARHKLATGKHTVSFTLEGRARTYHTTTSADLTAWIADLTAAISARESGRSTHRRAIVPRYR